MGLLRKLSKEEYVNVSGIGHGPSSPGMVSLAVTLPIIPLSSKSLLTQTKSGSHAKSKFLKKKKEERNHHLSVMHSVLVWLVQSPEHRGKCRKVAGDKKS